MVVAYQSPNESNDAKNTNLPMTLHLHLEDGQTLSVPGYDRITVGRDIRDNHTTVDLDSLNGAKLGISRRHVEILPLDGQLTVQDLYSVNGTWLNDKYLKAEVRYPLQNGDTLKIGQLTLQIEFSQVRLSNL